MGRGSQRLHTAYREPFLRSLLLLPVLFVQLLCTTLQILLSVPLPHGPITVFYWLAPAAPL